MLLKSHFLPEPSREHLDSSSPQLGERLDGVYGSDVSPINGGGASGKEDEVVFKTSPAMQLLRIPARASEEVKTAAEAVEVPHRKPLASSWRWPIALIVSTAIAVGGFLGYQKMNPPAPPVEPATGSTSSKIIEGDQASTSHPLSSTPEQGKKKIASLSPSDEKSTVEPGTKVHRKTSSDRDSKEEPTAKDKRRRAKKKAAHVRRAKQQDTQVAKSAAASKQPDPAPSPTTPPNEKAPIKPSGKPNPLDALLDDVLGIKGKVTTAAPKNKAIPVAPTSNLPEQLTYNQIRIAMGKIKGRVQSCYDQFQVEGTAKIKFQITPHGTIQNPKVRGKFRGTDTGDCVLKAVKRAKFPKFSGKPMTIKGYHFLLQ